MHLTRRTLLAAAAALSAPATLRAAASGSDGVSAAMSKAADVVVRRTYVDGPWGQVHMRVAQPARRRDDVKPALVCFHYSPGSARMYDAVLPLLATDRTVIAPDTPGYGASAPPPAQPTLPEYANALAVALAALGHGERGRPIDVMGHLTGSLLAVELATTRPRWIRKLVLSRSPAFDAERRRTYVADVLARAETRRQDSRGTYLIERLTRGLDGRPPGTPPSTYLGQFIDSVSPGDAWAWGDVAAIGYPAEDRFPRLLQPTLLLMYPDSKDEAWRRTPSLIPGARVVELTGASDWSWQLDPQRIAAPVLEFLAQTSLIRSA
jgi:pimeloyl-ACP methyl ester carboxylesterase